MIRNDKEKHKNKRNNHQLQVSLFNSTLSNSLPFKPVIFSNLKMKNNSRQLNFMNKMCNEAMQLLYCEFDNCN